MPYGDPAASRLELRHKDGTTVTREWAPEQWPPEIGQLIDDEEGPFRVAGIRREHGVTVVIALPAKLSARRVG